jgi:hypothetical protein
MGRKPSSQSGPGVTARFYCQGIGDCHLLKFTKANGDPFWMLIDCGVHTSVSGGAAKIREIVADIHAQTGGRLDVIVLTHEHWDHNSGFRSARDLFETFEIGEVWLAWTENPSDGQARDIDTFKVEGARALALAANKLASIPAASAPFRLSALSEGVAQLAGFLGGKDENGLYGVKGERTRDARDALVALGRGKVRYLEPDMAPFGPDGLSSSVRVYVLGPPRDRALLRTETNAGEMYGFGASAGLFAARAIAHALAPETSGAAERDEFAPFDEDEGYRMADLSTLEAKKEKGAAKLLEFLRKHYGPLTEPLGGKEPGRRIDYDWLDGSAELALQMDRGVNNTSLVLAFEFVETGRVLLFPGDAQVGNWLSWQKQEWDVAGARVTGPDLLARTVFYKVAHHGSENATLKGKGLEQMTHVDLAAFLPTNEADAKKVKWGAMPFRPILEALETRARSRVVRADDDWIGAAAQPGFAVPSGCLRRVEPGGKGLWVEMDIA